MAQTKTSPEIKTLLDTQTRTIKSSDQPSEGEPSYLKIYRLSRIGLARITITAETVFLYRVKISSKLHHHLKQLMMSTLI